MKVATVAVFSRREDINIVVNEMLIINHVNQIKTKDETKISCSRVRHCRDTFIMSYVGKQMQFNLVEIYMHCRIAN